MTAFGVDAFTIDDRCAQMLGSYRSISRDVRRAVARERERFVLEHIHDGTSLAVETTLRTVAALEQATLAHEHGFATEMLFLATDSVSENVARVLQRAQAGGHGAPEFDVRSIYHASIANLRAALAVFEQVNVYDSTIRWAPPRLVGVAKSGQLILRGPTPEWLSAVLGSTDP